MNFLFHRLGKLSVLLNPNFAENTPMEKKDHIHKGYVWLRTDKQLKINKSKHSHPWLSSLKRRHSFTSTKRRTGLSQWEFFLCLSQDKNFPLNFPPNFSVCCGITHPLSLEFLSIWASALYHLLISPFHTFQTDFYSCCAISLPHSLHLGVLSFRQHDKHLKLE